MIRVHAARLPAFCTAHHPPPPPPPLAPSCADKEPKTPATAEQLEKANFPLLPHPPTTTKIKGGGGGKKGGGGSSGSCFGLSTFHLEAVKRRFLQKARRQGNNPDSPPLIHAPLFPPKHMHICVPPPPTSFSPHDHRRHSAAAWQRSAGIDAVNGGETASAALTRSPWEARANAMSQR